MCIHAYVYIHIYMCVYTCIYMCLYLYVYIYIYIHVYIYIFIYIYMHTYICMYVYVYICVCVPCCSVRLRTLQACCVSVYMYVYIFIYLCIFWWACCSMLQCAAVHCNTLKCILFQHSFVETRHSTSTNQLSLDAVRITKIRSSLREGAIAHVRKTCTSMGGDSTRDCIGWD